MANFNVHVSLNKNQTMFFATIKDEAGNVIKEMVEFVGPLGPKLHQKLMNRKCVEWVKYEYQNTTETTSCDISASSIL